MRDLWEHLTSETRLFFEDTSAKKAILGMSGGIDSTLVFLICREALGENVKGLVMPSRFSSPETQTDAVRMLQETESELEVISIEPALRAFEQMIRLGGVAHENVQARIRMTLLMGLANQEHRLLVSTDNLSERMVGYSTLYGDSAGAIAPIGDLYKTEVFDLARWAHRNVFPFPVSILSRPPSAELSENQNDSDDLPDYPDLDRILMKLSAGESPEGPVEEHVRSLIVRSEFKRRQAPPAIRSTLRP